MAHQMTGLANCEISIAMTAQIDSVLCAHVHKPGLQEDLSFAYWRPSVGRGRFTAVITDLILPTDEDRVLHGNASFSSSYLRRVLAAAPQGSGVAFIHGHFGPGWQAMSCDDIVAERDRIAGPVAGKTGLPLVGLTRGVDGAWSGRIWLRQAPRIYEQRPVGTVRVIGSELSITYHPAATAVTPTRSQEATLSVWGDAAQEKIVRARVGIVGLGSVGSLIAEAFSRVGLVNLTYIDFDKVEERNLDRTSGATAADVGRMKVEVAADATARSSTSNKLNLLSVPHSILVPEGLAAALDCDVLICCVDRPWPRHLLNVLAYSHLIPVIDGGIFAAVRPDGTPLHVAWSIHTIGPDHACLVCLNALLRSDVGLDREGLLDDPDYIEGLSEEEKAKYARRNVFPFSMSVAAHEVLQLVGLLTGFPRIGGAGPQRSDCYPGTMKVDRNAKCDEDCEFTELTATAVDLTPNLDTRHDMHIRFRTYYTLADFYADRGGAGSSECDYGVSNWDDLATEPGPYTRQNRARVAMVEDTGDFYAWQKTSAGEGVMLLGTVGIGRPERVIAAFFADWPDTNGRPLSWFADRIERLNAEHGEQQV